MTELTEHLMYLKLPYIRENHEEAAKIAAGKEWSHLEYLAELITQESHLRKDKTIQRRIKSARFPVIKTLDEFNWTWPAKINQAHVKNLLRLKFIEEKSNVVFIGSVGVGNYAKFLVM